MKSKTPEHYYASTEGTICVVPATRFDGVVLVGGAAVAVSYPSHSYYAPKRHFITLLGILQDDYQRISPTLVAYHIAPRQYLVADAEAIAKATTNRHRATADGAYCYEHKVADLEFRSELPECTAPVYSF